MAGLSLSSALTLGLGPRGGAPAGYAFVTYNGQILTYNGEPIWVEI